MNPHSMESADDHQADHQVATTITPPRRNYIGWACLALYILNAVVTFVSNTGIYGCTNAGQSNKYFTLITPPGWAFSIWGIIFAYEAIACVCMCLGAVQSIVEPVVDRTFLFFWGAACVAQCAWSWTFCHSVDAAAVLLFAIFLSLLGLQQTSLRKVFGPQSKTPAQTSNGLDTNLNGGGIQTAASPSSSSCSTCCATNSQWVRYALLIAPFSIHLGWVLAASTLNINLAAVAHKVAAESLVALALCSLLWIALVAFWFGVTGTTQEGGSCSDVAMIAAVIWALVAVSQRDTTKPITTADGPTVFPSLVTSPLSTACLTAAALLFLGLSAIKATRVTWGKKQE